MSWELFLRYVDDIRVMLRCMKLGTNYEARFGLTWSQEAEECDLIEGVTEQQVTAD